MRRTRDRGKQSLKRYFDPQSSLPLTAGDKHERSGCRVWESCYLAGTIRCHANKDHAVHMNLTQTVLLPRFRTSQLPPVLSAFVEIKGAAGESPESLYYLSFTILTISPRIWCGYKGCQALQRSIGRIPRSSKVTSSRGIVTMGQKVQIWHPGKVNTCIAVLPLHRGAIILAQESSSGPLRDRSWVRVISVCQFVRTP